ncbi:alpha/beta fold hydrolase [Actinomadura barringtoniae]|uniref:Alpha/beta fold hydrolase n=1 Tax=Actinomadura barringtoniae TaxID=1427535 RepID=A0A939PT59_9ACTN|nr:alpha/beta hydrolase [Actinomadura barringtoniae]MBO2455838.1 alpha/beta fold hydrolase [Actinomadura barringtoniae]
MGRRSPLGLGLSLAASLAALAMLTGCVTVTGSPTVTNRDSNGGARPGAPSIDAAAITQRFHGRHLRWRGCSGHPGFQCTTIKVPLDYTRPSGPTLKLAVNRLRATDREHRIGSLITNPGGPGGSGLDYAYGAKKSIDAKVRARYDVIGIDPRGVGQSSPVKCLTDKELDRYYAIDFTPDNAREKAALRAANRRFAQACQRRSGKILPYIGSDNAARDMDIARAVLGDKKLNYLGVSYGTELGQVYAAEYPATTGRLVLDSVVDASAVNDGNDTTQAAAVQRTFDAFLADCVKRSDCPLGRSKTGAAKKVAALLKQLDKKPMRTTAGRPATQTDAQTAMLAATYTKAAWRDLRLTFKYALHGDGRGFRIIADGYNGRSRSGHYDPMQPANIAINCLGTPAAVRTSTADDAYAAKVAKVAPFFGGVYAATPCTSWTAPPTKSTAPITAKGAAPMLLLNNTGDNATPIEWAHDVIGRLRNRSVLVTNDGVGHGVYGRGPCVGKAVDTYLLAGTLPSRLSCEDA